MNLLSDEREDTARLKHSPGSYEWWYFDGGSHFSEYQFVVIFYDGCPFSIDYMDAWEKRRDHVSAQASRHPAVSISVYQNGKPIFYSLTEYSPYEAEFSSEKVFLRIGKHKLEGFIENGHLVYILRLDESLPSGDKISGVLRYTSRKPNHHLFNMGGSTLSAHNWNLIQPLAKVKGVISISRNGHSLKPITINSEGYHDHNFGTEPMKEAFIDWYWGRIHFSDYTLVYYIKQQKKGLIQNAWLIDADNQSVISTYTNITADNYLNNIFGLKCARRINVSNEKETLELDCSEIIDSGPFYYRFKVQGTLSRNNSKAIESAAGIAEYIKPDRIHARFFWPLVRMRLRTNWKKPHWVQRNGVMYRWTW